MDQTEEIIFDIEERESYCYACGSAIKHANILICADCLDQDCDHFCNKVAEILEIEPEELIKECK